MKYIPSIINRYLLFLLFAFIQAIAQENSWQFSGLQNEKVTAIAINPQNDSIIYAGSYSDFSGGTYGSIFKSNDGGSSWDTLIYGVSVNQLEIDPQNANVIYAALGGANFTNPGILKSIDQGITWFWADSGIYVNSETFVQCIAIDPFYPDTLYTGTAGSGPGTLYKSINGGIYWNDIGSGTGLRDGVVSISIDPQSSNTIYASTAWRGLLYKSMDSGDSWLEILVPWQDHGPATLKIDPENTDTIYAGVYQYGFMKSVDGGLTWVSSNSGLTENRITSVVINPVNYNKLYAGTYEAGIFHSVDQGSSWMQMNNGLSNMWVVLLAITHNGKMFFAGTYDGIYRYEISLQNVIFSREEYSIQNFKLYPNHPNPFNSITNIEYFLTKRTFITLSIYNLLGQKIKELVNKVQPAGQYQITWDGTDNFGNHVSSGEFIYHLETQEYSYSRKMIYLK
jgi:photosystem II stability/assembly factor-like uncharacterized protein